MSKSKAILATVLAPILLLASPSESWAQREDSVWLFSHDDCVSRFYLTPRYGEHKITVGRELFKASMYAKAGGWSNSSSTVTCDLTDNLSSPRPFTTLHLRFALSDNGRYRYKISVFLDGEEVTSTSFGAGQMKSILVDLGDARSLHVEYGSDNCQSCGFYFLKANLDRSSEGGSLMPSSDLSDEQVVLEQGQERRENQGQRVIVTDETPGQSSRQENAASDGVDLGETIDTVTDTARKVRRFLDIFK